MVSLRSLIYRSAPPPRHHHPSTLHPIAPLRTEAVDALRGAVMVWMAIFHGCFDLSHAGYWKQNFLSDPFWTLQRTAIVGLFLFCAGVGQALAMHHRQSWRHFGWRWAQIVAGALLVSIGSWVVFPQSFIYFGALHGIAAMLLLARCTAGWSRRGLWVAGAVALALPWLAQTLLAGPAAEWATEFNGKSLNWLGLVSRKPVTEDYVPVLPWMGIVWWGVASGRWLVAQQGGWWKASVPVGLRPLAVLGRWSLSYYLLHQPVLMGILWLLGWVGLPR